MHRKYLSSTTNAAAIRRMIEDMISSDLTKHLYLIVCRAIKVGIDNIKAINYRVLLWKIVYVHTNIDIDERSLNIRCISLLNIFIFFFV